MKCLEEQTLHRFMRGALIEGERSAIEAHVDACPACRRAIAALVAETPSEEALATTALSPASSSAVDDEESGLAPGARVDHFRVERPLGAGGMGVVYLAEDTQLRRKVALKIIRPHLLRGDDGAARLLREARTTARFNHPNIVTIHHVGTHGVAPYLALEYLDGETLRQRMERGALQQEALVEVILAVAGALQEAHDSGVLHRDLKPENVMLPSDGRLRVLDFGLSAVHAARPSPPDAPLAELPPGQSAVTHHHSLRGTPAYMAPEQWRGEACSEASDIWALGVLLHELIAGQRPFRQDDLVSLRARVLDAQPAPKLSEGAASDELRALCAACLDKRPEERPAAAQVIVALSTQRSEAAAVPTGGALGYVFLLVGLLFALSGLTLVLGTISDWMAGSSESLLATDVIVFCAFGLAPAALGAVGLQQGLRRRPGGVFLITLGVLVILLGATVALGLLGALVTGDTEDPLAFNVLLLVVLGLIPAVGGGLLVLRGIATRRRRAASARSERGQPSPAGPTAPQRRAALDDPCAPPPRSQG